MDRTRIRWRNVGRLAGGLGAGALLLIVVPGLLEPRRPAAAARRRRARPRRGGRLRLCAGHARTARAPEPAARPGATRVGVDPRPTPAAAPPPRPPRAPDRGRRSARSAPAPAAPRPPRRAGACARPRPTSARRHRRRPRHRPPPAPGPPSETPNPPSPPRAEPARDPAAPPAAQPVRLRALREETRMTHRDRTGPRSPAAADDRARGCCSPRWRRSRWPGAPRPATTSSPSAAR